MKKIVISLILIIVIIIFYFVKDLSFYSNSVKNKFKYEGIDLSHHNKVDNWIEISNQNHFCILKATEGSNFRDPKFKIYWSEAKKRNLIVGAYHYFKPNISAEKQFALFKETVNLQKGDLPPILDVEEKEFNIEEVNKWIKLCIKHYQVEPILYTEYFFFKVFLEYRIENCKLWIHLNEKYNLFPSFSNNECIIWQANHESKIKGIQDTVDKDYFLIDSTQINNLLIK